MQANEMNIWFPAKKYGWGWGFPNCWQGWLIVAEYLVLLSAGTFLLLRETGLLLGYATLLTIFLIIIRYLKGEKPRWRWGKE